MRVALLTPFSRSFDNFYSLFGEIASVAARQLDVELDVLEGTGDPRVLVQRGRELVARTVRPDYVLLANHMGVASELLPVFAEARVGVLLVAEGLGAADRVAIGPAGCSTYLGEIVPSDVEAGRLLAEVLVAEGRRRGMVAPGSPLGMGILCGMQTQVNSQRFRGWKAYKEGDANVVQSGFRYAGHDEGGEAAAALLLRGAPQTHLLWCFNDVIALGGLKAAVALGRKPGADLLVGGFDLIERALAEISQGAMHASVGGHIVDGARAVILLQDHHAKRDLAPATHTSRLDPVTASDAARYLRFMRDRSWRTADFTRFSGRRTGGAPEELSLRALVDDPRLG